MSKHESKVTPVKVKPRAYLREWRIHQGLTLQDVADRMGGYHRSQVSQWETGGRGLSENRILEYCDAIGVSVSNIYNLPDAKSIDALLENATPEQKSKAYLLVKLLLDQE